MKILKEDCGAVLIDVQEKLYPHMDGREKLLDNLLILIEGLKLLNIPVVVTQQYTKGLGATIEPIMSVLETKQVVEKISFSCCDENIFNTELASLDKKFIIVAGIEAHICVLQTVIDLLSAGYIPVVIEDGVSSRNKINKTVAVERMRNEGAIITTCESILFELCRFAGTETFKGIARLVK